MQPEYYGSQFCPQCPTDMPEYRDIGQWVGVEGHEHQFPLARPDVYLYDDTPGAHLWQASLNVVTDNGWLGAREFPTLSEAMDYSVQVLVPLSLIRSEAILRHSRYIDPFQHDTPSYTGIGG